MKLRYSLKYLKIAEFLEIQYDEPLVHSEIEIIVE